MGAGSKSPGDRPEDRPIINEVARNACGLFPPFSAFFDRDGVRLFGDEWLRALSGESPIRPENVQKYLEGTFGDALEDVSNAMLELAKPLPPSQLAEKAYALYKQFRPELPPGKKGWAASGKLDLDLIRKIASA